MTQIKICGLTRIQDMEAVNRWKPDYIGFVFAKSKRQVTSEWAKNLKERLHPDIKSVGVFVNEQVQTIAQIVNDCIVDVVQLHGDETEEYIKDLKKYINCPIIKAVSVQSSEDIIRVEKFPCDFLLLDSYTKHQYGGNGITFDHTLIPEISKPYFVAGGLNINNVRKATESNYPYGVDISSGVESDGFKDEFKIKNIIELIRKI